MSAKIRVTEGSEEYLKIIDEIAEEVVGDKLVSGEVNTAHTRLSITIREKNSCGYGGDTLILKDGYFLIDDLPFDSIDFFREYIRQLMLVKIKKQILDLYKRGILKKLPSKMSRLEPSNPTFENITEKWFKEKFEVIAEEESNSETIEDLKFEMIGKALHISFAVDCGRRGVHRANKISISERGDICMGLAEVIEGGDIEHHLRIAIEERIKP